MVSLEEELKLIGLPRLGPDSNEASADIDVTKEAQDFERAKHNVEQMKFFRERILKLIRRRFRANPYRMKDKKIDKELKIDNTKVADVQFQLRHNKTRYADILAGMEAKLQGIDYLALRGSDLVNIILEDDEPYILASHLLEEFDVILSGNLNQAIRCVIKPIGEYPQPKDKLLVPRGCYEQLSWNTIALWVALEAALKPEETYVKLFKEFAASGAPEDGERITPTQKRNEVIEAKVIKRQDVDYTDVVRTLISVPTEIHEREPWDPELPYLARDDLTIRQIQRLLPWYDLFELKNKRKRQEPGIYVGCQSVEDRIEDLIDGDQKRVIVNLAEVKKTFG